MAGVLTTVLHALLGGAVGALGGPLGAVIGAVVGLVFGAVFGWTLQVGKVYHLASANGVWLFVVDHTWSLVNTMVGAIFLALNLVAGNRIDHSLCNHSGCVMLTGGVFRGFATTIGTVQAGTTPRIRRHENLHVLQARLFGPLYLPLVILNYALATIAPYWLIYHDRVSRPIDSFGAYFMRGVYPNVWHEKWAYSVEGSPP
jgi:hypothetical protein